MNKEHYLTLLNKIYNSIDKTLLSEWPGNFSCEMNQSMDTISKLDFNTNKCNIIMWTDWSVRKLCVKFKVNNGVIENYHPIPRWGLRWTSPVWRKWKNLSRLINKKHKKVEELKREKYSEEQIEEFNNFFYNSFPEEIDDILFNKDDD